VLAKKSPKEREIMQKESNLGASTKVEEAEIVREYGPFGEGSRVHGVTFDGRLVWFATGEALRALEPKTGDVVRSFELASDAGTAFDGRFFYQLAERRILKVDAETGAVVGTIPAPGNGNDSGLTWAEGSLWVGQYRDRKIYQLDPESGAILRTIESNRFVTGVTWVEGELWHGTWEGEESELRRVDPENGDVLTCLRMPVGTGVSGLESDGAELLYAGGGSSGKVRAVRRPKTKG
jgi:outer membrane protein assembly factor BamB